MHAWIGGWVSGWMGGWVDGWTDGCMDGWMATVNFFKGNSDLLISKLSV